MIIDWTAGAQDQSRGYYGVPTDAWDWSTVAVEVTPEPPRRHGVAAFMAKRRRRNGSKCAWLIPILLPGLTMRRAA
jgi:hypothetical protein